MKKIGQRILIVVVILTMIMPYSFAAGNKNGHYKNGKIETKNEVKNYEASEQLREQMRLMVSFGDGDWANIPYGFMTEEGISLPPGLTKQYRNGRMPYGIAKRYSDWINFVKDRDDEEDDEDEDTVSRVALNELIEEAEALLDDIDDEDVDVYDPDDTFVDALEDEVKDASEVYDDEDASQDEVDEAYEDLLEALEALRGQVVVDIDELEDLLEELEAYYALYFGTTETTLLASSVATDDLEIKLDALIKEIKAFIADDVPLTQGQLDTFEEAAELFVDYLDMLEELVEEVDSMLDDLVDDEKIGDDAGDYSLVAKNALLVVLNEAKVLVVDDDNNDDLQMLATAYSNLVAALEVFELQINISIAEENPIFVIYTELSAMYAGDFSGDTDLQELLEDIEALTPLPFIMTQEAYNDLMDEAGEYLEGLYDGILVDLLEKVEDAVEMYDEAVQDGTHWNSAELELMDAIELVADLSQDPYELLVEETYAALTQAMVDLDDAMTLFESKALIDVTKRAELLNMYMDLVKNDYPDAEAGAEDALMELLKEKVKYPDVDPSESEYIAFEDDLDAFYAAYNSDPKTHTDEEVEALFGKMTLLNYNARVAAYDAIVNVPVTE